jgi:hypothetical protein
MELSRDLQSVSEARAAALRPRSDHAILTAKRAGDLQVGDVVAVAASLLGLRVRSIRVGTKIIVDLGSQGGVFELEPDELVCVLRDAN